MFSGFLCLMLERPKGALRKPATFFQSREAFSQSENVEMVPFWEWGFLDGHIPPLPVGHAVGKGKGVTGRPVPGHCRSPGVAEGRVPGLHPLAPSETGPRNLPGITVFGPGPTNGCYMEPPGAQSSTAPQSEWSPPPTPQDKHSDLYPWKLMGQSGYNWFSM